MKMNDIQFMNIIWILVSFAILYYGITGSSLWTSFLIIIGLFLFFWWQGTRLKIREFNERSGIVGDKVKGQWER